MRALLRQPEVVVGTWLAARAEAPDVTEREVREALCRLDPLWDELFPAEQARIVQALTAEEVKARSYNLDFKNPHAVAVAEAHGDPATLAAELEAAEAVATQRLENMTGMCQAALGRSTNRPHRGKKQPGR